MTKSEDNWISVGRIGRPHGLKGVFHVDLYNADSDILEQLNSVAVRQEDAEPQTREVREASRTPRGYLLGLEGVDSREAASKLTNAEIHVRRTELPDVEAGTYYCADLIGFKVRTPAGRLLGELKEIFSTGANDIYAVEGGEGEILLPAISSVIRKVDMAGRTVVADPPEVVDAV